MEAPIATRRKPPYASAAVIDSFFDKIKSIGPPPVVDSKWATQYGLDPKLPSSIPTMLKWIGVVDESLKPTSQVWNKIRFQNTRAEALAPLVREGYREIFDAITVEDADKEIIEATFGQTYGSGDVGRIVTCFLTLCRHAGIATKVGVGRQTDGQPTHRTTRTVPVVSQKPKKEEAKKPKATPDRGQSHPLALALNLTVEIPAEWTEEQIEKRIETISKALQATIS